MLTIQSNLKIQDLETLAKILIKPDIINFGLNKVGGGYTDKIADKVIVKLSKLDKNKIIVIINDITLQMADKLLEAGYKNIYLAFGRFNKDGSVSKDKTVYNIMKAIIKNNIKEKLNVISLEEIFNMKIDGIIANPPYSKIGAVITDVIINKINYEEYINLLPANDYRRWNEIYKYVDLDSVETVKDGFKETGADVTTRISRILKTTNGISKEEFERSTYIDASLNKYFEENFKRQHYAIDNYDSGRGNRVATWSPDNTLIIHTRNVSDGHLGGKDCYPYIWNVLKQTNVEELLSKYNTNRANINGYYEVHFSGFIFKTNLEKENITNFLYSKDGFRFIAKIFTAMNVDGLCAMNKPIPKVDWTRSWTVEEILRDYGYTEEEIAEVMADLDNFKGMDD